MSGIASLALWCSLLSTQTGPLPPMESVAEMELPQLFKQLGSDSYRERRAATRKLIAAGMSAKPYLKAAQNSPDWEIRQRAKELLADLDFGITPDTDPAIRAHLREFRDGNATERNAAFQSLIATLSLDELRALIKSQPESTRAGWTGQLFNHLSAPERFAHPEDVVMFMDAVGDGTTWRQQALAVALFSPKMLAKWIASRELDAIKPIIKELPAAERSEFITGIFQTALSVRALLENDQFEFLMQLIDQLSTDSERVQALARFTYDSQAIALLVQKKHWKTFIKAFEKIKDDAAREQLIQTVFNRSDAIKNILDTEGLEYLLEMAKGIKNLTTRGQILARLFADSTIQQHLKKEGIGDLPRLIAERERDPAVRREYLKTLLQLIRYRNDVEPTLVDALWTMVKADKDVSWQVETAGYIVQSSLGQRILKKPEEMKWVLDLMGTEEGKKGGQNALRYLVQNSNNLDMALEQGHFEQLWQLIRNEEGGSRQSLLSSLLRSSTLMKQLEEKKQVDWFLKTIEEEKEPELRNAMMIAVFQNYTAMNSLLENDEFDRMWKLIDSVEPESQKAKCYGTFLKNSKVSGLLITEKRHDDLMRFAKDDTPAEVRDEFLMQLLDNSAAMAELGKLKKLDKLREHCDKAKDENSKISLLSKYFGNTTVVAKMLEDGKATELLEFGNTLQGNTRRYYLQQLLSNNDVIKSLLAAKRVDDIFDWVRKTPDRYQRTSLFSSLIQSNNLDSFVQHKALHSLIELVEQERDDYARRQMVYYLLGRSDSVPKVIKTGKFESLLRLVETLDDRTRADMLLRMFSSPDSRKELAKTDRLRKIVDSGMYGSTEMAQQYFQERLFGNSSALDALVQEGYFGELESFVMSADPAKRLTYQINLYTGSTAIKNLTEQSRLGLLLELAVNQPNEALGTNLFARVVGNENTVKVLDDEGRFDELLQIAANCSDTTQRGYRKAYMLASAAMLSRLNEEKQIKPMIKEVLGSDLKAVRTRLLSNISSNTMLADKAVDLGFLDEIMSRMEEDVQESKQQRTLASFLTRPAVLAADKNGKYLDRLFELLEAETNSYNRSNIITSLANASSMRVLLEGGRMKDLIKQVEREPSASRKAVLYRSALLTSDAMTAIVEARLTKELVGIVKGGNSTLEDYFLSAFVSSDMQNFLADPSLAVCYFELVKSKPESSRAGYLQILLRNPEARDALIAAGNRDLINQSLKLLPEGDVSGLETLLYSAKGIVTGLLRKGMDDEAVELAQQHLGEDILMLRYATTLLLTKKLDAEIDRVRSLAEPAADDSRLLVYLLRARGDVADALAAAEKLADPALIKSMAVEARDWQLAAKLQAERPELPIELPRTNAVYLEIEHLGLLASYQRLAGQVESAAKTLDAIKAQQLESPSDSNLAWHAAQAMFLNGRFSDGLDMLTPAEPAAADGTPTTNATRLLTLRIYRQEYQDALKLHDVSDPGALLGKNSDNIRLLLRIAGLHESLGQPAKADLLTTAIERWASGLPDNTAESNDTDESTAKGTARKAALSQLVNHYYRMDRLDDVWRIADELSDPMRLMASLYPTTSTSTRYLEASAWMKLLHKEQPDTPLSTKAKMIHRIVAAPPEPGDEKWFRPLAEGALKQLLEAKGADDEESTTRTASEMDAPMLRGMAATCARRGLDDIAEKALGRAAEASPAMTSVYANFLFKQERWKEAAEQFKKQFEQSEESVAALYLEGYCLLQSGEEQAGQALMDEANRMSVLSRTRHAMTRVLLDRGLIDEGKENAQLILRTAPPEHWEHNDANRLLGIHSPDDFAASAKHWEVYTLGNLRTNFYFNQTSSYLSIPMLIHKLKIVVALEAKDLERAKREATLCQDASLASTNPLEHLADKLRKLGQEGVLDQLFERSFEHYSQLVAAYPDSSLLNNNLAWLCAMADRKLELALQHAEKAVKLAPAKGGYLDTLAEVHFRKGDVAKAVKLEEKAVRLDPANATLKKQLKRFQAGRPADDAE